MPKMSIEWHRKCLIARRDSYARTHERVKRELDGLDKEYGDIQFLFGQIKRAEKEGKTHFDGEKFNHKRKKT